MVMASWAMALVDIQPTAAVASVATARDSTVLRIIILCLPLLSVRLRLSC
jgi:hypothetical protein